MLQAQSADIKSAIDGLEGRINGRLDQIEAKQQLLLDAFQAGANPSPSAGGSGGGGGGDNGGGGDSGGGCGGDDSEMIAGELDIDDDAVVDETFACTIMSLKWWGL